MECTENKSKNLSNIMERARTAQISPTESTLEMKLIALSGGGCTTEQKSANTDSPSIFGSETSSAISGEPSAFDSASSDGATLRRTAMSPSRLALIIFTALFEERSGCLTVDVSELQDVVFLSSTFNGLSRRNSRQTWIAAAKHTALSFVSWRSKCRRICENKSFDRIS